IASQVVSPLRNRETGFFNSYLVGQSDVARRISGLVPARFPNKAATKTSNWTYTNYSGIQTFKQGLTDPFGGTSAASISSSSSPMEVLSMGDCVPYTPTAGDWIVAGVWAKGLQPPGNAFKIGCYGYPTPTPSTSYQFGGAVAGDGQWNYIWTAFKVASGSATYIGDASIFSKSI